MVPPGVCRVYLASFHSKLNFRPVEFVTIKASKKMGCPYSGASSIQANTTMEWLQPVLGDNVCVA